MSEYTAEDFAKAMFAEHPDPDAVDARYAARMNRDPEYPWLLDGVPGNGDEHMARGGWVPVRVANGRRDRDTYIDHIADQDRVIRRRNDEIAALRERCASLEDDCSQLIEERESPLSLDALAEAWEAAEVPTEDNPIREGDVVLEPHYAGDLFNVFRQGHHGITAGEHGRILSRAPRREPWQDLADIIGRYEGDTDDPAGLARFLRENEVTTPFDHDAGRVTGGDE